MFKKGSFVDKTFVAAKKGLKIYENVLRGEDGEIPFPEGEKGLKSLPHQVSRPTLW
jgi:hypothetical protein